MPENAPALPHFLRPLLTPSSVAVVGASDVAGSPGRIVAENLFGSDYTGKLFAIDARRRKLLGRRTFRSLVAVGEPIDLALIAGAPERVAAIIDDAGEARVGAALLLIDVPLADRALHARWMRDLVKRARRRGVRLVGPGAFGIVRTDVALNASVSDVPIAMGRLALVAQSGAVCAAMLDFAAPLGIGFSTVLSYGGGIDVDVGQILDALLLDPATDAILLYVETVHDARRFVSALRAAARVKPVVVLRAGRSSDTPNVTLDAPTADAVFEAALRRAGTVRVRTYTQLFAAARILSMGRIPRGDAIGIVANGRGPGVLAADSALERGVRVAKLSDDTRRQLDDIVPGTGTPDNPVDVGSDAPPQRFANAVAALLGDAAVDGVVALHVPRPQIGATDTARAVADASRRSDKPVLGAWLGSLDRQDVREALEAGRATNFYTPENAVEAFSFLASYRRHQEWLLEAPPSQPEPMTPDLAAARRVREEAAHGRVTTLGSEAAHALLAAFGIDLLPEAEVRTAQQAKDAGRALGYPVSLVLEGELDARPIVHERLRDARSMQRAFEILAATPSRTRRRVRWIKVRKEPRDQAIATLSLGVTTDATFGPIIALDASRARGSARADAVLMLPPLNRRLADDLLDAVVDHSLGDIPRESLLRLVLQISSLVCALPWVVEVTLDLHVGIDGAVASCARLRVDVRRPSGPNYPHMAIHPYPAELESEYVARNGVRVHIRPIRPDDAEREQRFVTGLSEESRYFRFFHRLQSLSPAMLARFTQVDYDREMALVAVVPDAAGVKGLAFAGVARFVANGDGRSAEYALVVADAWQRQGLGRALMERLIATARSRGIARLEGAVLQANVAMLRFVETLGFVTRDDPDDADQVLTSLNLA